MGTAEENRVEYIKSLEERWGSTPSILEPGELYPVATGNVFVLDGMHTVTIDQGHGPRTYYLGIDPKHGWVRTSVETDTIIGG